MNLFNLPIVLTLSALAFVHLVDAQLEKFDGSSPVASGYGGASNFKSQSTSNIEEDDADDFYGAYKTKPDDTDAEPEDFGLRPNELQNNIRDNDEEGLNGSLAGMSDEQLSSNLYNKGNGTPEVDDIDSDTGLSPSIDAENAALYGASDSEIAFSGNDLTQDSFKAAEESSMNGDLESNLISPPPAPVYPATSLPNKPANPSGLTKSSSGKAPLVQKLHAPATTKTMSNAKQVKAVKKVKVALPANSQPKHNASANKAQGKDKKKKAGKTVKPHKPTAKKPLNKKVAKKAALKNKPGKQNASKKAKASGKPKAKTPGHK